MDVFRDFKSCARAMATDLRRNVQGLRDRITGSYASCPRINRGNKRVNVNIRHV